MTQRRLRIPYGRRFVLPPIPVRPRPMFDYEAPQVVRPPAPLAPTTSPDYERAVQRLAKTIRPPAAPRVVQPRDMPPVRSGVPVTYRPPLPTRPRGSGAQPVVRPPLPPQARVMVRAEDIGPVGPPAHVSLADIGPVGEQPDMPDWVQYELKRMNQPAQVNQPQMPKAMVKEGRQGVNVKPQPSDYVPPPVTTPKNPVGRFDVAPAASDEEIRSLIEGDFRPTYEPGDDERALQLKDLGLDLLKGTSKYAAGIGQTQGRILGEGV